MTDTRPRRHCDLRRAIAPGTDARKRHSKIQKQTAFASVISLTSTLTPNTLWGSDGAGTPPRRGRSSVGRAREWHSRGQGFDPPRLHSDGPAGEAAEPPAGGRWGGAESP